MKKTFVLCLLLSACSLVAFSQVSFSVSPGMLYNTATFGYRSGNINPYIGINAASVNSKSSSSYESLVGFDDNGNPIYENVEVETKMNMTAIIPTVGTRYYFPMSDGISAYANAAVMIPIIRIKYDYDGDIYEPLEDDFDKFSLWGARLGFGAEYNFNRSFSLGGEFGFNYYHMGVAVDDGFSDSKISGAVAPTYSRITLNFLLGKSTASE